MALVPAPEPKDAEGRLLFFGTCEIETIVACAALARALDAPLGRVFAPVWGLGSLADLPAFRKGEARTVVTGFPAPSLAWRPPEAIRALRAARDLTWVTPHPVDLAGVEGLGGVEVVHSGRDPWPALAATLDLPLAEAEGFAGLLAGLPDELPDGDPPDRDLAWRLALEAARQDPPSLGTVSRALAEGGEPDPELVGAGRALVAERRDLARSSRFHTFPVAGGSGVVVPVPRSSVGFYRDLAADARRLRGCAVHLLCFDSHEPTIVGYAEPPGDLEPRMGLARAALPGHEVLPWGEAGFAVAGPDAGGLEVLEKLIDVLGRDIQ